MFASCHCRDPKGLVERYSTYRHHHGFYLNVGITAYYQKHKSPDADRGGILQPTLRNLIYGALHHMVARHPMLTALPVEEASKDPYFMRLPTLDLAKAVSFYELPATGGAAVLMNNALDAVLESEHNKKFTEHGAPYWRVVVGYTASEPGFWLTWVYHHALADATSGLVFHRELRGAIESVVRVEEEDVSPVIVPPRTPLPPALESLHQLPLSLPFLLRALWNDSWFGRPAPQLWAGGEHRLPLKTRCRSLEISAAKTSTLMQECRRQKTTVTGLAQAAIAAAIFDVFPEHDAVALVGNVSMRRWLPSSNITGVTEDTIGCYITQFQDRFSRKNFFDRGEADSQPRRRVGDGIAGGLWAEARRSREVIKKVIDNHGRDTDCGLLRYVTNYDSFFQGKIGKPRTQSLEVSNVGVFDGEPKAAADDPAPANGSTSPGSWRISRMLFSQSACVAGCALECSIVSVKDGPMNLAFTWQEGVIETGDVMTVVDGVRKRLELEIES